MTANIEKAQIAIRILHTFTKESSCKIIELLQSGVELETSQIVEALNFDPGRANYDLNKMKELGILMTHKIAKKRFAHSLNPLIIGQLNDLVDNCFVIKIAD